MKISIPCGEYVPTLKLFKIKVQSISAQEEEEEEEEEEYSPLS